MGTHRAQQASQFRHSDCMGTDGQDTYHGAHFVGYINVESLRCTPETKTILYANYT